MTAPAEPDVEDIVIAYLSPLVAAGSCAARVPADPIPLPFILVQRVAGGNDYVWDYATLDVDFLAASQTAASDLAIQGHHMMRQLTPKNLLAVDGANTSICHIEYDQTPIWVDYQDPIVMRYVARYTIAVRLPSIPGF